jgi:hypothetical protein
MKCLLYTYHSNVKYLSIHRKNTHKKGFVQENTAPIGNYQSDSKFEHIYTHVQHNGFIRATSAGPTMTSVDERLGRDKLAAIPPTAAGSGIASRYGGRQSSPPHPAREREMHSKSASIYPKRLPQIPTSLSVE